MPMIGCPAVDSTVTTCCGVLASVPSAWARARRRWIASISSTRCARNASPSFWVHASCSSIMLRTCGKTTRDFTLSSQFCAVSASFSAAPLRSGLVRAKRAAITTSSG